MVNFFDTRIGKRIRDWKYNRIFNALSEGDVVIDCGANVGKVTKRMAKPGVIVYSFEPDPNAFKELKNNMGHVQNVHLMNKAVSDHSGRMKLYFNDRYDEDPKKWSVGSTLLKDKPHVDKENFVEVEVVNLIEFIRGINKPIAVMKMDIEGEEVAVLNSLIDSGLDKSIKKVLVETHERFPVIRESTEKLKERVKELGLNNFDFDWA